MSNAYYFDELIVSEIKKDNAVALKELYKTHYSMILNLILSNSGTEQEAKDVYQETVIAFYEKVHDPGFELTCKIKTYLYAVARRLWLKRLAEKKRYVGKVDEFETFLSIEEDLQTIEEREKVMELMGTSLEGLGEPCKSLLEDFYIHDLSMDAIAAKYQYTNSDNAKNQKYKCLQRLKKSFFSNYDSKAS